MKRYAIVTGRTLTADVVSAYLPSGYHVIWEGTVAEWSPTVEHHGPLDEPCVVVAGEDWHGWTLDGYVIPRLGSGCMYAREIDLSHPVMKLISAGA